MKIEKMKKCIKSSQLVSLLVVILISSSVECDGFWKGASRPSLDNTQLSVPWKASSRSLLAGDDRDLSSDDSSGKPSTSNEDGARCLISRHPNFKKWPSVRFYTSKQENDVHYGCSGGLNFDLTQVQAWLDDDYNSFDSQTGLMKDELNLKEKLIDMQLYDGSVNTYFLVHGFLATWSSDPWMCSLKDFILENSEANVFIVDWSGGSKPTLPIDYSASVADVEPVANLLAMLSQKLIDLSGQDDASKFHFIGHSLGSHISGLSGYALNGTLGRITAYDPAGFCFTNSLLIPTLMSGRDAYKLSFSGDSEATSEQKVELERARKTGQLNGGRIRLSQASARFVLALHTDITMFGIQENVAHVDVYVNGGQLQPSCPANTLSGRFNSILELKLSDVFNVQISCSHSYSHDLWKSWSPLGMNSKQDHTYDPTCYPMAYQCGSWNAYKAGECGMCTDLDPLCAYTGFSSHFQSVSLDPDSPEAHLDNNTNSMANFYDNDNGDDDDDDSPRFPLNGDDDDSANDDDFSRGDLASAIRDATSELSFGGQSRHFMKTSDKEPFCMYHYQILIGAKREPTANSIFYVQMPLDNSGKYFRQVRVSHPIRKNTHVHKLLVQKLKVLYNKSNSRNMPKLNYYSALITFASLEDSHCAKSKAPFQNSSSGHWQACEPLKYLNGTKLKSDSAQELNSVELVAINYMSGLSLKSRRAFSHLLNADTSRAIMRTANTRARTTTISSPSSSGSNRRARTNEESNQVSSPSSSGLFWNPVVGLLGNFGSSSRAMSSISQGTQGILNAATFPVRCTLGSTSCQSSGSQNVRKIEPDYSVPLRSVK